MAAVCKGPLGGGPVFEVVDADRSFRRHRVGDDMIAVQARLRGEQHIGAARVDGAVHQPRRRQVLAAVDARPHRLAGGEQRRRNRVSSTRSMRIGCACAHTSLTLTTESAPDSSSMRERRVDVGGRRSGEVGCRVITDIRLVALIEHPLHGVLNDRQVRRLVARQFSRTHERHFASERSGHRGNFWILGREDHSIERADRCALRSCKRAAVVPPSNLRFLPGMPLDRRGR